MQETALAQTALVDLLSDLSEIVVELPADVYRAAVSGKISGSIGEHVRHCLDHVESLLSAGTTETLSYDHRTRGTSAETDPERALHQILRLQAALARWPAGELDEPLFVSSMIAPDGTTIGGWSTRARELAFVISHTIHHQAIIALLLSFHGHRAPDRFGHSPSTPRRN